MNDSRKKKAGRIHTVKRFASSSAAFPVICEMLFSLLTMPLVFYFFRNMMDESGPHTDIAFLYFIGIYVCLGLRRFFQGFRCRKESRSDYFKLSIYGAVFLAAAVLMAVVGDGLAARMISGVYILTLVVDRIISCVRKRRLTNIILNFLVGFVLVSVFIETVSSEDIYFLEALLILLGAILSTLSFVFGRIKVGMLTDIIRQTYAAEIIGGLLLLIFVFSFMLMIFERNITNYGDGLWYCFAIVTTIGFGDIAATSLIGRIMSVILGVYGIVVVALITSIIVAFYGEMKKDVIKLKEGEGEDREDGEDREEGEDREDGEGREDRKAGEDQPDA